MIILLIIRIRITNLMIVIMPRLTSCYLVSLEIEAGADPYIPRNLFILDTRTRGFNSTLDRRMGLIIYQIIGRVQFYARQQDGFNSILNTRTGSILYQILKGRVQVYTTQILWTGSIQYQILQDGFNSILDTLGRVQFYTQYNRTGSFQYQIHQERFNSILDPLVRVQFYTTYYRPDGFNSILDTRKGTGSIIIYPRYTRTGSILYQIHQDGFNFILDPLGRVQF